MTYDPWPDWPDEAIDRLVVALHEFENRTWWQRVRDRALTVTAPVSMVAYRVRRWLR